MEQKKQEAYADYSRYSDKTLRQYLDIDALDPTDREIIQMILKGRKNETLPRH